LTSKHVLMVAAVMLSCSGVCSAQTLRPASYWKCPTGKPGPVKQMGFNARVEARYSLTQDGPALPSWGSRDDHQGGDGYNTRRLRASYGHQFGEDLLAYAHVRRDWGMDEFEIRDAYLTYSGWDFANLTVGQMKAPFSRDHLTSHIKNPLAERSLISTILAPKRDVGLLLHKADCTDTFGWYAGIYGGDGTNKTNTHGTYLTVLRAEYLATPELNVALDWAHNNSPLNTPYQKLLKKNDGAYGLQTLYDAEAVDEDAWGLDLSFAHGGTRAWAGYTRSNIEGGGRSVAADGWYVKAGHHLPWRGETNTLELVAGYEEFDPNTDLADRLDARWLTIGFNYHVAKSNCQWRLQYVVRDEKQDDVSNNTLILDYEHTFR